LPIKCEQFIYGHFNGIGYRFIRTPNLTQKLSKKSIGYLKNLKGNSIVQTLLPENIVAVTHLNYGKDEYGRKTVWNHTILVSMNDYFDLHPPTLFEPLFIKNLEKPIEILEPVKVG